MTGIILVGIGGFLGASARYLLGSYINIYWKGAFPLGTFIINALGSFLLGLITFHPAFVEAINKDLSVGIGVGFLGAFTTFSTFQYETLQLLESGKIKTAILYVTSSFFAGICLAWLTQFL